MKNNYTKTPTVYQMEATECGAASLAMIFAYFGKFVALEQMRIETGVSRDGCNAANIMRAAKKFGLDCHGYRKELSGLFELRPPCIIHWNFNHFVVYEGIKHGYVYINDPAVGRRKMTVEEVNESFTGIVLTFAITDSFEKEKKKRTFSGFVHERLKGHYNIIFKLMFIGLLLVFPGLVVPVASKFIIDEILVTGNTHWIDATIAFVCAAVVLEAILMLYRGILLRNLRNKMTLLSTHGFLSHMFRLPISFFDQRYVGDLCTRIDSNSNVSTFLAGEFAQTMLNIPVACSYLILMILYSPVLTLIGICTVAVNVLSVKLGSNYISNMTVKLQQDAGKLAGSVGAGLSITSTLKASGMENDYAARVLGFYAKTIGSEQELGRTQQLTNAIMQFVSHISSILVVAIGGIYVLGGSMSVGTLVAFGVLLTSFTAPVNELVGFMRRIQTLKADMGRIDDIMNYETDDKFDPDVKYKSMRTKLAGKVELSGVSFGYSILEKPLITDFGFTLTPGSSIAFVGPSGSGKSTVSKLVSGLYTPWSGTVSFDGMKYSDISSEVISASVSTVSQNITLFSGTIRDNITMWNQSVPEEDIIKAAKDACIHDVIIQKPGAYDYMLTEGAANLSGGQRQRLEIARALVTNPTVLIMDEATSALDPVVEKQIIDNIKRRGCSCVIVAHRLSAIRDCDTIIVMEKGKIKDRGSFEELSDTNSIYQSCTDAM